MKISDNSNENIQNSEEKEDESTLYILNEVNKWITVDYITKMLKNYGVNIEIKNLDNFKLATIHRSYSPSTEDLHTCMDIAESVVESVYIHPQKANALKKKIPKRK